MDEPIADVLPCVRNTHWAHEANPNAPLLINDYLVRAANGALNCRALRSPINHPEVNDRMGCVTDAGKLRAFNAHLQKGRTNEWRFMVE